MIGFQIPDNVTNRLNDPGVVKNIWSYVQSMQEQMEYYLRNLDQSNFNYDGLKEIAGMFKADTIISNTNITQELYAAYGNISDLTVDKLRTDYKKAKMYLSGDLSNVNYIYVHDETISFITAKTDGNGTEQLVDGDKKFYWTDDTYAQMTDQKETAFPVMIFKYTETIVTSITFSEIALPNGLTTVMPMIMLGSGSVWNKDALKGRSFIYRYDDGLYIDYYSSDEGNLRQIKLGDDGITMTPDIITMPDCYNSAAVSATAETTLQGINVSFYKNTRVSFAVQLDITASAAMTVTVKARIGGITNRFCTKYFSGAYKDCVTLAGVFDNVTVGKKTVDVTITPSIGTATIAAKDYRLSLIVRNGTSEEAQPWPAIDVADAIAMLKIRDSLTVTKPTGNDSDGLTETLTIPALTDSVEFALV